MKTLLKILGGLALLALAAFVLANLVAGSRLARHERRWRETIAAVRQQEAAVRMPVMLGETIDENAAVRLRALLASQRSLTAERYKPALRAAQAGPCAAIPPEATVLLDKHRGELTQLREALRGSRVDWEFPYEEGWLAPLPMMLPARTLGTLLVLEGHERAQKGDTDGAADRYLLATRFGADLGAPSALIMSLVGMAVAQMGVDALGGLVAGCPSTLDTARLATRLEQIRPVLPTIASGLRGERLALGSFSTRSGLAAAVDASGRRPFLVHAARPLAAHAITTMDTLLEDLSRTAALDDPRELRRASDAAARESAKSWNRIVRHMMPRLDRARLASVELQTRFRLVEAALSLEQHKTIEGHYPSTLPPKPGLEDPFAWPSRLRYRLSASGDGYTLWSVGADEKDDGGASPPDIVLQRAAVHSPSRTTR